MIRPSKKKKKKKTAPPALLPLYTTTFAGHMASCMVVGEEACVEHPALAPIPRAGPTALAISRRSWPAAEAGGQLVWAPSGKLDLILVLLGDRPVIES